MPETFTQYFLRQGKDEFDLLLFDIDGTLSAGGRPLPGARELLGLLSERVFPHLLLTNDSCNSHREKAALLHECGLPVGEEHIFSCGDVLKLWAARENYKGVQQTSGSLILPGSRWISSVSSSSGRPRIRMRRPAHSLRAASARVAGSSRRSIRLSPDGGRTW